MTTEIEYVVNNPTDRKPEKVRILRAGTENVITKDEVKYLDSEAVNLWLLLGLSRDQVKAIVGFLRS